MAVQKKQEKEIEEQKVEEKAAVDEIGVKREIIADDVIVKTTGKVEIIEEAPKEPARNASQSDAGGEKPEEKKVEDKKSEEAESAKDPLTEFKEKMNKEEDAGFEVPVKKNYMWPILIIFIAVIILFVGIFLYKRGGVSISQGGNEAAKATVSPTAAPEPTTEEIDLAKYEIEVQNGSGIDGEASRQKEALEEGGFVVSSVGNADNSDYTDTIIKTKEDVDADFIEKLEDFLGESFTLGEAETLSEDSSTPVVVIIGTAN